MKHMIKHLIRIAFVLLTLWSLWYADLVLSIKSWHGIDQTRSLYYQPRNTIDVVCIGSSHVHCDIDTSTLWKEYGIAAFDYTGAEQPLWNSYHYLVEFCKYQTPKVVVLDLFSPVINNDTWHYPWIQQNLYGMRFSLNKLQMLLTSVELSRLPEFFPAFVSYHNRYTEITREDLLYPFTARASLRRFKGFTPYLNISPQERPELDQEQSGTLDVKSETYLVKIIEYCQARDISLYLVVTPYITNEHHELIFNRIKEIANQYGVDFNSTNYDYDEMGLDFQADFNDNSHLNYWGAVKFTRYLAQRLKEQYDLPDRRGDPAYQSWEENYEEIITYVEENKGKNIVVE